MVNFCNLLPSSHNIFSACSLALDANIFETVLNGMGGGKSIILHFLNQNGECQLFALHTLNEHLPHDEIFDGLLLDKYQSCLNIYRLDKPESLSAIPHLISLFSFNCSLLLGFLHCLQIADVDIASNKLELISLYPSANLLVIFRFPKVIVSDLVLPSKNCFFYKQTIF